MAITDPITGLQTPDVTTPAVGANPTTLPTLPPIGATPTTPANTFQFDPNKYLPDIQNQANSIYNPQQAQLDALAKLQTSKAEQAKITTREQFAKELAARKEAINQRGAFFGGGAVNQENDVLKRESYALNDIDFQAQADQAGMLAQKAGLSAAQADYIKNQLMTAQGGAYSQFQDQRTFDANQKQNDRQYQLDLAQFGQHQAEFNYSKEQDLKNFEQQKLQYEQNYALDVQKFGQEVANDNFQQNMMTAEFDYRKAQDQKEFDFKKSEADRNYKLDVDKFGFAQATQKWQENMDILRLEQDQKEFSMNYELQLKQIDADKKRSKAQKAADKAKLAEDKRQFDETLAVRKAELAKKGSDKGVNW